MFDSSYSHKLLHAVRNNMKILFTYTADWLVLVILAILSGTISSLENNACLSGDSCNDVVNIKALKIYRYLDTIKPIRLYVLLQPCESIIIGFKGQYSRVWIYRFEIQNGQPDVTPAIHNKWFLVIRSKMTTLIKKYLIEKRQEILKAVKSHLESSNICNLIPVVVFLQNGDFDIGLLNTGLQIFRNVHRVDLSHDLKMVKYPMN